MGLPGRRRHLWLLNDHPADRFAALGPAASVLLHPSPLHDYHGPGSVLERLSRDGVAVGRVAVQHRLGCTRAEVVTGRLVPVGAFGALVRHDQVAPPVPPDQEPDVVPQGDPPKPGEHTPMIAAPRLPTVSCSSRLAPRWGTRTTTLDPRSDVSHSS